MAKKSTPTIDEQIQQRLGGVYVALVQENAHLTLTELQDMIKDKTALEFLLNTPLRELAGIDVEAKPKAKNGARDKAKKKTPTNGVTAKSTPAMDLDSFLKGKKKGDTFKTAEYTNSAKIIQQTALNHLSACKGVKKEGNRRAMRWVVQ